MQGVRAVGRVISWVLVALLALLLAASLYMAVARRVTGEPLPTVFGWTWAVIISGSMEPELEVNDLILVRSESGYAVGDVIAYKSGGDAVTHRIVAETAEGYTTKGDANNTCDLRPVPQEDVIGRVVYTIPKLGLVIGYLRTPLGMLCVALAGFLLIEISGFMKGRRESKGG